MSIKRESSRKALVNAVARSKHSVKGNQLLFLLRDLHHPLPTPPTKGLHSRHEGQICTIIIILSVKENGRFVPGTPHPRNPASRGAHLGTELGRPLGGAAGGAESCGYSWSRRRQPGTTPSRSCGCATPQSGRVRDGPCPPTDLQSLAGARVSPRGGWEGEWA